MDEELSLSQWTRKRKITTILSMVHASFVGLESIAVSISALYYLHDILHVQQARVFYGLTMGSMFFSSVISSIFLGRYMDQTRNGRKIIIGSVLLAILGNLLYSLPYSPWLLVIGRFLCGFSDATLPVMSGEFTRCYKQNELSDVMAKYSMVYTLSFAFGPCTALILQWIHYYHWPIILSPYNSVGIILMMLQMVFLISVYFRFSNLSDEPGYHIFAKMKEQDELESISVDVSAETDFPGSKTESEKSMALRATQGNSLLKQKKDVVTMKDMITNFNIALVCCSSALNNSLSCIIEVLLNIICLYTLKWTMTDIGIATALGFGLSAMISLLSYKRLLNNARNIFFLNMILLILAWMNMCVLLLIYEHFVHVFTAEMVVVTLLLCSSIYSGPTALATGRLMLFSLVPSHSSSSCEGVRLGFSRVMLGLAYYLAPLIYLEMVYTFAGFILIILFLCVCFWIKRDVFF